jgi:cytochrome P450
MDDGQLAPALEAIVDEALRLDAPIDSPAIRRLLEEVRAEEVDVPRGYNRTFNRHNR